jgi:hypothetical protein
VAALAGNEAGCVAAAAVDLWPEAEAEDLARQGNPSHELVARRNIAAHVDASRFAYFSYAIRSCYLGINLVSPLLG